MMNLDVEEILRTYDARIAALNRELVLTLAANEKLRAQIEELRKLKDGDAGE